MYISAQFGWQKAIIFLRFGLNIYKQIFVMILNL